MPGEFVFSAQVVPICQLGMSDVIQAEPDSWLDVSCYVHEVEVFRGRERFNDRFQPGTASVTFDNDDGWGDLPGLPAQVEQRELRPGRPIRIGVRGPFAPSGGYDPDAPVTTRWLFRGHIDQAVPDYDPVKHDIVSINCIDAFGESGLPQMPGGPLVGVNEPVHARINRVLNEVSWWPAKRDIAAGTALLQGTTLAGRATDLMTVAADSAGGVVFGNLDGDVAYRDIDWMLYDPDDPHDGEIGNCAPGERPREPEPPYDNPDPGDPPFDPDPPVEPPTSIKFCLGPNDGTDGRVIEHGQDYSIYVKRAADGHQHLYYESHGFVWDMGIWEPEGGCTTITPPGPRPPTPPGEPPVPPTEPPTRCDCPLDDPDCECEPHGPVCPPDVPDCDPDNPGPEPPGAGFTVVLLGYSDGLEPLETVTVAGLDPTPGSLLIVLACALCDNLPAGTLTPFPVAGGSITGGPITFEEIAREPAGQNGAESYAAAARTPRSDPGTIDVVVDWSDANRSREHIVTVWEVTAEKPDLLDRMKIGAYKRALTWDRPDPNGPVAPEPNPPGKGPWSIDLIDPSSDQLATPSILDVVIAQSLADSPTGPFGARFNDVDGPWWTPEFADEPTALARAAASFADDFERADGELGADWMAAPAGPTPPGGSPPMPVIAGGTAVDPVSDPSVDQARYAFYATPVTGDYSVEIDIASVGAGNNWVAVLAAFEIATFSGLEWSFVTSTVGTDGNLRRNIWAAGEVSTFVVDHVDSPAAMKVDKLGTHYVLSYIPAGGTDYVVAEELDAPELEGGYAGIRTEWSSSAAASPAIAAFRVGSSGFCDDFERADGPLGPDWELPPMPIEPTSYTAQLPEISGGNVIAPPQDAGGGVNLGEARWATPIGEGDQFVEVVVGGLKPPPGGGDSSGRVWLFAQMSETTGARDAAYLFQQRSTLDGANMNFGKELNTYDTAGELWDLPWHEYTDEPVPADDPTHTFRLEAQADGVMRLFVDGALVGETPSVGEGDVPVTGPYVGFALLTEGPVVNRPWIESVCAGGGGGTGIRRKCSWVAGYRPDFSAWPATITAPDVRWDEVNYGPDFIQSCQAAVVVEPIWPDQFGWHQLAVYARAPEPPATIPPMSHSSTVRPAAHSMLVVFVGAFAGPDVTGGITVSSNHGLTWARNMSRGPDSLGHGQGTIFTAQTPGTAIPPDDPLEVTVAWDAALEGVTYAITEVFFGDTIGGTGSGVRGTHSSAFPADGPGSALLSRAPDPGSVCIGYLAALADPAREDGPAPGATWTEELEYLPNEWAYLQLQSRLASNDANVDWADVNEAAAPALDVIMLAAEITQPATMPTDDLSGILTIGGSTDAYSGPIYSAGAYRADGTPIWEFNPGDFV